MPKASFCVLAAAITLLVVVAPSTVEASITGVTEVNLGTDTPAVIETDFNEDQLAFSDRTHQHNGAAFDATTDLLSTSGTNIVGLPVYLTGHDYVRFANNARDNAGYTATITADELSHFYLLVDNRLDGVAGSTGSPNTTDPVLGGSLQWIIDDGWERVNTGISPGGQADYTGVDEGGDGTGAGVGLNQFYSVYRLTNRTSVTCGSQEIGGSNMYAVVVVGPIPVGLQSFVVE